MNTFTLSQFHLPLRKSVRPLELRQEDFDVKFDNDTLFYDVFTRGGKLFFIGPPIDKNTLDIVIRNTTINDIELNSYGYFLYESKRTTKIIVNLKDNISLKIFDLEVKDLNRKKSNTPKFNKVLYTLQKNNDIQWIKDWIDWHINNHNVDTVIIYNNSSDAYSLAHLEESIQREDCCILVFDLPFKHGPGAFNGSSWDSAFLQASAFEHVRYAYCNENSLLLNVDIDELVITSIDTSIFSSVKDDNSVGFFNGKWVEIENKQINDTISHKSHTIVNTESKCPNKWIANLAKMPDDVFLQVHDMYGSKINKIQLDNVLYLHFKCISTNWKWDRSKKVNFNQDNHRYFELNLKKFDFSYFN